MEYKEYGWQITAEQPIGPYAQGQIDGTWMSEDKSTAEQTLARLEQEYAETIDAMQSCNNAGANTQIEYWDGLIAAARESLRAQM